MGTVEQFEEMPGIAAVRVHLSPLGEQDSLALLASLLPGALPPEAEKLILARAEGNPLFVEEITRMLVERGDLKRAGERWEFSPAPGGLPVPNTLQGVLMARVDELPGNARRVLQVASVLGREFSVELLEQVLARLEKQGL
jgi:predicted ATPase